MVAKILYVDDNPDDILLMKYSFKEYEEQAELYTFKDPRNFLMFITKQGEYEGRGPLEGPCCVLLDINMPYFDGFEVLQKLKTISDKNIQNLPVVMFSSSFRDIDRETGKAMGALEHIMKPLNLDEMSEIINKVITSLNSKGQIIGSVSSGPSSCCELI